MGSSSRPDTFSIQSDQPIKILIRSPAVIEIVWIKCRHAIRRGLNVFLRFFKFARSPFPVFRRESMVTPMSLLQRSSVFISEESFLQVAFSTVLTWLRDETHFECVDRIVFCCFLREDFNIYQKVSGTSLSGDSCGSVDLE